MRCDNELLHPPDWIGASTVFTFDWFQTLKDDKASKLKILGNGQHCGRSICFGRLDFAQNWLDAVACLLLKVRRKVWKLKEKAIYVLWIECMFVRSDFLRSKVANSSFSKLCLITYLSLTLLFEHASRLAHLNFSAATRRLPQPVVSLNNVRGRPGEKCAQIDTFWCRDPDGQKC